MSREKLLRIKDLSAEIGDVLLDSEVQARLGNNGYSYATVCRISDELHRLRMACDRAYDGFGVSA